MQNIFSHIYLASTSQRRQELLKQIAVPFTTLAISIDESLLPGETVEAHVLRLAREKALAGLALATENYPVLAADTVVFIDDKVLGKPKNKQDYLEMMQLLSGKKHEVLTAVCLATPTEQKTELATTKVIFRKLTSNEIDYYWDHYNPSDKAGGYAIQDFAAVFIEEIQGSYSNVVGLPLHLVYELLINFSSK